MRETSDVEPVGPLVRAGTGPSRVRFQVLFGPLSAHPYRMGWSVLADEDEPVAATGPHIGHWYGWRLMGANNRELGRSAMSFVSYPLARRSVYQLQRGADALARHTLADPATGRWSWRVDLDDVPVAVSGRWYERDHDSRLAVDKFVRQIIDAGLADGVVTMHDRRRPGAARTVRGNRTVAGDAP